MTTKYKTQSLDTHIDIELLQFQGLRKFSTCQRAELIRGLTKGCLEICSIGIRHQYPNASLSQTRCEFARRTLGEEIAKQFYNYYKEDERPLIILDPIGLALEVADILDNIGIPYLVGGSLASSLLGEPRSTADLDFVADLSPEMVSAFVQAIQPGFYVSEAAVRDAIAGQSSFNILHQTTMSKVDIFILKNQPLELSEFDRRRAVAVRQDPERSLFLPSPEDIILQKLVCDRLGREISDRQWRDILGVLKLQGDKLDFGYLWQWAEELQLLDLLDSALGESGL